MSSEKKNKKHKRKDKKRRIQAREKRGTLPPSVQALLGYLGNGGPTPAPQTDVKVRERAGVDNIDTLSQIIRQQQVQSASYMQNLQNMAFKNDMTNQLKEQSTKLQEQTSTQLKGVVAAVEEAVEETRAEVAKVRQYNYKSIDDKIEKAKRAILNEQGVTKRPIDEDKLIKKRKELARLEEIKVHEQSLGTSRYQPPTATIAQLDHSIPLAPVAKGGGAVVAPKKTSARAGQTNQTVSVEPAQSSKQLSLPAQDPRGREMQGGLEAPKEKKKKKGGGATHAEHADVEANKHLFTSEMGGGGSSGNASLQQYPLRNSPQAAVGRLHRY